MNLRLTYFADDSNNFLKLDLGTLSRIKEILIRFKILSGLECNVDKSYLMRFGDLSGEVSQEIVDLGFPIANSITVLGFVLQNQGDLASVNFAKKKRKILNIIRFWERFNLSLPGKIAIYKTLLIPQLNFIASILTPSVDFLTIVENEIEKFITKGLNIARERLYSKVSEGGLGLFNLKNFVIALQVSWIKRASLNTNDNWKVTLNELLGGNVLNLTTANLNPPLGTALQNIVSSFLELKKKYRLFGNNFLNETIFKSDIFGAGRGNAAPFDELFFGDELMAAHGPLIRSLKMGDLIVNGSFIDVDNFEHLIGFRCTRARHTAIKNAYVRVMKTWGDSRSEPTTIEEFFGKIKRGSKNFRKVLEFVAEKDVKINQSRALKTYSKITESQFTTELRAKNTIKQWNVFSFPNRLKVFVFKYYTNILGTGNRIQHFVRDAEPSCIFCVKNLLLPAPIETFTHVFFDCPIVNKIVGQFFNKYITVPLDRTKFFTGEFSDKERENNGISIVLDCFRYTIWQMRLLKNRLSFFTVELEINELLGTLTSTNKKLKYLVTQNVLYCPDGTAERERGPGGDGHGNPGPP